MRVAMILQSYFPRLGGAERQLRTVAPLLRARGVEIDILTRRYAGMAAFERIDGIPVYRLPIPGPKPVAAMTFTLAALNLLRKLRPDLIHAYDLLTPTTIALAARRLSGIPVVVKVLRGGPLGDLDRLKRNPLSASRVPMIAEQVDAFVTISQEIDQELAEIGIPPARRAFIPNGIDIQRFAPLSGHEKTDRRAALGLSHAPTAIYTGRLVPEKGLDQLIRLWPSIRQKHPTAELLLPGKGEQEKALRAMAGKGVHFPGYQEDVAAYLQAADLFILPSMTEGLSNAMLEAMATGLPVIATAVGGAPDVIIPGVNGLLVPPGDPQALETAILRLLGNPEMRSALGARARERICDGYDRSATADKLVSLYQKLLDTKHPRMGHPVPRRQKASS